MSWQPGVTLEDIERETIKQALAFYRGNKTKTAASLDIAIRTLDYKLEKYRQLEEAQKEVPQAWPQQAPVIEEPEQNDYVDPEGYK
jgi:hypothetical protein